MPLDSVGERMLTVPFFSSQPDTPIAFVFSSLLLSVIQKGVKPVLHVTE